jgi:mRNA-degrading endonuclease toxin of MazEF toxin-antitoxin module
MTPQRGAIAIVDFSFSDRPGSKVRPALAVRSNALNRVQIDTIQAIITSKSSGRTRTEGFSRPETRDLRREPKSGLRLNAYLQCDTLITLDPSRILAVIGSLPPQAMGQVDDALRAAPGI